jgi:hypothetical protein
MALSCAKSPCKLLLLVYYAPHLLLLTVWAFARTTDKAKAPPAGASGARGSVKGGYILSCFFGGIIGGIEIRGLRGEEKGGEQGGVSLFFLG